jgi:hypothetical protein
MIDKLINLYFSCNLFFAIHLFNYSFVNELEGKNHIGIFMSIYHYKSYRKLYLKY